MGASDLFHVARLGSRRGRPLPSVRQVLTVLAGITMVAAADPRPLTFQIGAVITALGWSIRVWSFGHLRKNEELTTSGPYRHSRHPAYFGSLVCLTGVGLAAGNAESQQGQIVWGFLAFLIIVFFGFYLPRKFDRETTRMHELFGEQMERWSANVPRFLPRLTPWAEGSKGRFSWAQVTENHEWPWGVVLTAVLLGIANVEAWSPFA